MLPWIPPGIQTPSNHALSLVSCFLLAASAGLVVVKSSKSGCKTPFILLIFRVERLAEAEAIAESYDDASCILHIVCPVSCLENVLPSCSLRHRSRNKHLEPVT